MTNTNFIVTIAFFWFSDRHKVDIPLILRAVFSFGTSLTSLSSVCTACSVDVASNQSFCSEGKNNFPFANLIHILSLWFEWILWPRTMFHDNKKSSLLLGVSVICLNANLYRSKTKIMCVSVSYIDSDSYSVFIVIIVIIIVNHAGHVGHARQCGFRTSHVFKG